MGVDPFGDTIDDFGNHGEKLIGMFIGYVFQTCNSEVTTHLILVTAATEVEDF